MLAGKQNAANRSAWIEKTLAKIPRGYRILDAGAGEQRFRKFCSHLGYVAQDFGKYDGKGDGIGLQMGTWDETGLDIICDISEIPEPDGSFDAIMCTEVFEHLPDPVAAIREFNRLLRGDGYLIITAPFCSLTHYSPYHFYTGFNRYFYQKHLVENGFKIIELESNGNFFEYLGQEIRRIKSMAKRFTGRSPTPLQYLAMIYVLKTLTRFSRRDRGSDTVLCFGYHILARKQQ